MVSVKKRKVDMENRPFKDEWIELFWVSEWLIPSLLWNARAGSHWVHKFNLPQVRFNLFSGSEVNIYCRFQYGYKGHAK